MNLFGDSTKFFVVFVPKLPMLILGLLAGYIGVKLLTMSIKKGLRLIKTPKAVIDVTVPLVTILLWIVFFSEFARHLGLSGLAVTFSGILIVAGLALSNGATVLISDLIAGLYLAKDKDFDEGFKIKFDGVEGVVKKVDLRKVRVETKDGSTVIIPNSKFDSTGWELISKSEK